MCAGHSGTAGGPVEAVGSGGVVCAGGCSTQTGTTLSARNRGAPEVRERRLHIEVNSLTMLVVKNRYGIRYFFASLFLKLVTFTVVIHNNLISVTNGRLIKHTERLLEEKEEKLCIKVLQTLKEMMTVDIDYGEKVCYTLC